MKWLDLATYAAAATVLAGCATHRAETTTAAAYDAAVNTGELTTVVDGGAIYQVTVPESGAAATQ